MRASNLPLAGVSHDSYAMIDTPSALARIPAPAADAAHPPDDAFAIAGRILVLVRALRERGIVIGEREQIEALAETILSAPALRDPADRRAQQLADVLGHLERRVRAILADAMAVQDQTEQAKERHLPEAAVVASLPPGADFVSIESKLSPLVPAEAGTQRLTDKNWMPACAGMSGVCVSANETRSNAGLPEKRAPVVRTILAVQTEPSAPRSSASLLEGLNAFADLSAAGSARLAVSVTGDIETMAMGATPPPPAVPVRQMAPAPQAARAPDMRTRRTTANDPLAALMSLSDEERIALFS